MTEKKTSAVLAPESLAQYDVILIEVEGNLSHTTNNASNMSSYIAVHFATGSSLSTAESNSGRGFEIVELNNTNSGTEEAQVYATIPLAKRYVLYKNSAKVGTHYYMLMLSNGNMYTLESMYVGIQVKVGSQSNAGSFNGKFRIYGANW